MLRLLGTYPALGTWAQCLFLRESRRKTPVAVTLKENERFFGDNAASLVSYQPTPFPDAVSRGKEVTDPESVSLSISYIRGR